MRCLNNEKLERLLQRFFYTTFFCLHQLLKRKVGATNGVTKVCALPPPRLLDTSPLYSAKFFFPKFPFFYKPKFSPKKSRFTNFRGHILNLCLNQPNANVYNHVKINQNILLFFLTLLNAGLGSFFCFLVVVEEVSD